MCEVIKEWTSNAKEFHGINDLPLMRFCVLNSRDKKHQQLSYSLGTYMNHLIDMDVLSLVY